MPPPLADDRPTVPALSTTPTPSPNGASRPAPAPDEAPAPDDGADTAAEVARLRRELQTVKAGLRAASRRSVWELPQVFRTDDEFREHLETLRELREQDPPGEGLADDEQPDPEALKEFLAFAERRREIAAEARRLRLAAND